MASEIALLPDRTEREAHLVLRPTFFQRRLLFGLLFGRSSSIGEPCLSPSTRLRPGSASWSTTHKSSCLHYTSLAWWRGRAVQLTSGRRCALFEQSEFAHRRSRRTAEETRRAMPRPTWFWVLLPKQKGLGCRAETRHHRKTISRDDLLTAQ